VVFPVFELILSLKVFLTVKKQKAVRLFGIIKHHSEAEMLPCPVLLETALSLVGRVSMVYLIYK
jgi:hypothetical protein